MDGTVAATWSVSRVEDIATMTVRPVRSLVAEDRAAVRAEADRLLRFVYPNAAEHRVMLTA